MLRGWKLSCLLLVSMAGMGCTDDEFPLPDSGPDLGVSDASAPSDGAPVDGMVLTDASGVCGLEITTINGTPVSSIPKLSSSLDQDAGKSGIQLTVEVDGGDLPDGTTIELAVTGLSPTPRATVTSGRAVFSGVTVGTTTGIVQLRPQSGGCVGPSLSYNVQPDPTCVFVSPTAGETLTVADDRIKNPDNGVFDGTFNYDVVLQTTNAAPDGGVALHVGAASQGSSTIDAAQRARFSVVLSPGSNTLTATVTAGELSSTCQVVVTVNVSGPVCNITGFTPSALVTSAGLGLGVQQDANSLPSDGVQTTLTVATDGIADHVLLTESGATLGDLVPTVGQAAFQLNLTEQRTYYFKARCVDNDTGNSSESPTMRAIVDTTKPPPVADLTCVVSSNRVGEMTCRWTAVGDGQSAMDHYQLRYRINSDIGAANFDDEDTIRVQPDPLAAPVGQRQALITGLSIPNRYTFAIKAVDLLGNVSDISNLAPPITMDFNVQQILGEPGSKFGIPTVVGDFNCDQLTDVAVGLFDATVGSNAQAGEVQLFFSNGASGLPATFSKRIQGTKAIGQFAIAMTSLDFNGDGCTDLAVSSNEDGQRGRVYLYLGRPVWTDRTDDRPDTGAEIVYRLPTSAGPSEALGVSISTADLDRDGHDDLAVSYQLEAAPYWASVLVDYGESGLTLMRTGITSIVRELPTAAELQVTGGLQTNRFASIMGRGGLLNSDAYGDLLIGSMFHQVDGVRRGAAYVLLGAERSSPPEVIDINASPNSRIIRITGTEAQANSLFGRSLGGVGDVDGDGTAEFAIADNLAQSTAGAVYVFSLNGATPSTTADAKAVLRNDLQPSTNNFFGVWVANGVETGGGRGGIDLNGDGLADILVGMARTGSEAVGSARIFFGNTSFSDRTVSGADVILQPESGGTVTYGNPSVFLGDINGDSIADVLIGESAYNSNQGRLFIYY